MISISYVLGKKVRVLTEAITECSKAMTIEADVLCLKLCGSLAGTLSGHCLVH